jgi:predicted porin
MLSTHALRAGIIIALSLISLFSIPARGNDASASSLADLEELLSELTDALSPQSKRAVQIYGQLNRAIMFWDDGTKSRAYAVDNDTSSSRLGLIGNHPFHSELSVGYRLEIDSRVTSSFLVSNDDPWGHPNEGVIRLRHAYGYLEDSKLGRLTVGQQSPATDNLALLNLGSQMNDAAVHYNNDFGIWLKMGRGFITDLKWGQIAYNVDSLRGLFARYDTPLMGGIVLSAAWGDDNIWDVAARYQTERNSFRLVAGVGYMDDPERRYREAKGSASLIHEPTGLYVSLAGGVRDNSIDSANGLAHFNYAQLGISKQWLPYGKTTFYADYGFYKNFNVGNILQADFTNPGELVIWGMLAETEVRRWGFGAEQSFDKTGLLLYAQAHHYEARVIGYPCDIVPASSPETCGGDPNNLAVLPTKPWFGFVTGARIRF